MKRDEQDRLLNEIISGEELAEFRRASLTAGLEAIQRRTRRRRAVRTGVLALVPVLLLLTLFFGRRHSFTGNPLPHDAEQAGNVAVPAVQIAPPIKVISDEELLALFPDRSIALLGPPGQQQLVFLDKAKKIEDPRRM
jgi:hypothetical protein